MQRQLCIILNSDQVISTIGDPDFIEELEVNEVAPAWLSQFICQQSAKKLFLFKQHVLEVKKFQQQNQTHILIVEQANDLGFVEHRVNKQLQCHLCG